MIKLETKNLSYIINVNELGKLENIYFGNKIDILSIPNEFNIEYPNSVVYDKSISNKTLDRVNLELSENGLGDYRTSSIELVSEYGYTTDFIYKSHCFLDKEENDSIMPYGRNFTKLLKVVMYDKNLDIEVNMYYRTYYETDVISRYMTITNVGNNKIALRKAMSICFDMDDGDYDLVSFKGHWVKEHQQYITPINCGIYINDSKCGTSSNVTNPLFIIKGKTTNDYHGECYGFNLVYSGNHIQHVERSTVGKIRIMSGINNHMFNYDLQKNISFMTPEAVFTYSKDGLNNLSTNFHNFVNNHIIPERFMNKVRPILINNWEATYFDFNKKIILDIARQAKDVGIELFCLDDGWFGNRNDDSSSLGDWFENTVKLNGTLKDLCCEINDLGLKMGIWFEPEMISKKSELYLKHPEWVVGKNRISCARNQYVLDVTNKQVQQHMINAVSNVLDTTNIKYVKWDMNRHISDVFTSNLNDQGNFFHEYVLGFYTVIRYLTDKYNDVLFEGCSAGGNRFDLGVLSFMPQIWLSDNTDSYERYNMQTHISYGYPQNCYTAHISSVPNHQTNRITTLNSRFNISFMANLGYELNLLDLNEEEKSIIKKQVEIYKDFRNVCQYGTFKRIDNGLLITYQDVTLVLEYQFLQKPNPNLKRIKILYLNDEDTYEVSSIEDNNLTKNITAKGSYLKYYGLSNQPIIGDFNSRLHIIRRI